jgi:hypothetical protein
VRIVRILSLLAMMMSASAMAQVFKCTDASGQVTYTETACSKDTAQQQTLNIVARATPRATSIVAAPARNWAAENEAFRQRQADREAAAELSAPRPPAAAAPSAEAPSGPRHFIRRHNPAPGK